MTQELARVGSESSAISLDETFRLGDVLAQSNFFQDARNANQAVAKILLGREIGLGPMQSLLNLHVVKGKPTLSAGVIASAIKGSAKYDYQVVRHDDSVCEIDFYEGAKKLGTSTFTKEDARRVQTQNMDKWAKNMLFARCISNGYKFYCPDVFSSPVYTPEEMGSAVDERGDMQAAEVETATPDEPAIFRDLRHAHSWGGIDTQALRDALAWLKNNKPNDDLKKQVVAELRKRADEAKATPPTPPAEEVHAGEVVEDAPHPGDALEPYAETFENTPDVEPSPLTQAVKEKREAATAPKTKAPGHVIKFAEKCKEAGLDFDNRDARMAAMESWLTANGYTNLVPLQSSKAVPAGIMHLMTQDLGVTLVW